MSDLIQNTDPTFNGVLTPVDKEASFDNESLSNLLAETTSIKDLFMNHSSSIAKKMDTQNKYLDDMMTKTARYRKDKENSDLVLLTYMESLVDKTSDMLNLLREDEKNKISNISEGFKVALKDFSPETPEIETVVNLPDITKNESLEGIGNTSTETPTKSEEEKPTQENPTNNPTDKLGNRIVTSFQNVSQYLGEKITGLSNIFGSQTKELKQGLINSMLGPITLFSETFKGFLNFDFFKSKKSRRNPTAEEVAKKGDSGSLLLYNLFHQSFKNEDGTFSLASILSGTGGFLSTLGSLFLKALPIAGIFASVGWAIADGIKAMDLAEEWGTSETSAFLGGFLGGTGEGWKNAFKNGTKWAIAGVSAGLAFGPVGAIAGGLLGAAIGALLGFIGGEKIANFLDEVWTGMGEKMQEIAEAGGSWIGEQFGKVADFFGLDVNKDGESNNPYFRNSGSPNPSPPPVVGSQGSENYDNIQSTQKLGIPEETSPLTLDSPQVVELLTKVVENTKEPSVVLVDKNTGEEINYESLRGGDWGGLNQ